MVMTYFMLVKDHPDYYMDNRLEDTVQGDNGRHTGEKWRQLGKGWQQWRWETDVTVFTCGPLSPPPRTPTWLYQCPKRLTWIYPDSLSKVTNSKQGRADLTRRGRHKGQKSVFCGWPASLRPKTATARRPRWARAASSLPAAGAPARKAHARPEGQLSAAPTDGILHGG